MSCNRREAAEQCERNTIQSWSDKGVNIVNVAKDKMSTFNQLI